MSKRFSVHFLVACIGLLTFFCQTAHAVCARVVIQIEQELTLEREGFEARLGVSNGLPSSLEDFQVTLNFSDVDGNPVGAYTTGQGAPTDKFFYRVQTGFSSPASVAAGAEHKVAYLIVPAPGAAGTSSSGALYYVGATIKYRVAGEQQTVEVAPDYITVRPMPSLQLQYFLPGDVYGDDPATVAEEPVVPFALGVRVSNHSPYAYARKVKIDSGQPEIIENEQGLLIDFRIVGCQVNGSPAQPSLLVDLGDVAPRRASVANWLMTSSLSGKFVKFSAEVAHAPEFGGALTSLIPEDAISTHRLIGQVLVDLPGRDALLDFLATDLMVGEYSSAKIYESDNDEISLPVDYYAPGNGLVSLSASQTSPILEVNATSPMFFVRMASPIASDKRVRAVRSDGKVLSAANAWISKSKNSSDQWVYWLNLFDTNKELAQTYSLTFSDYPLENRSPELTLQGGANFNVSLGQTLSIIASATDPDGLIPTLSTASLPDGAIFSDARDGSGVFTWTPTAGQLGSYLVQFRASDGIATASKTARIQVVSGIIGGFQSWQASHWPGITDLSIVGPDADPDGDQLNNLLEYALDSDPNVLDESVLPQIGIEKIGELSYLTLSYRRRTDDPSLQFEVVAADNAYAPIASWVAQTQTLDVDQGGLPAGLQRVKVRDSMPIETGPIHRYLRLRVTKVESP